MTGDESPIARALAMPNGAQFYRCALQVNPYAYLLRHKQPTQYADESAYNAAMIDVCKTVGIQALAITDHLRVKTAVQFRREAEAAGLVVFPGFEAKTKDGIHVLCLFDPGTGVDKLDRIIGDCGIHDDSEDSPCAKYDVVELLAESKRWGAICVAAHLASPGGLLHGLDGKSRANAWRSPDLLVGSLPGPISDAPANLRPILENENPDYRRERRIAIVNAQDASSPVDLAKAGASCWIKMSNVSVGGLRQAFLDPVSRIRLASDPATEAHVEFAVMTWQGGFLDGQAVHLNENLNVLVGGRGTGKSTLIESLRYVLDLEPIGENAQRAHEGIVQKVLKGGTKVSLLVRCHRPSRRDYLIERTVPNPPLVRDEAGQVLDLKPQDIIPQVEVYGQHEIAELANSPEKRTHLLRRFVAPDASLEQRRIQVRRELERSRDQILKLRGEIADAEERLAALPALEEKLRRYQAAGVEVRLQEQSLLVREERVLESTEERFSPFREILGYLRRDLPIDLTFLSPKALSDLPGRDLLGEANTVFESLSRQLEDTANQIAQALQVADEGLTRIRRRWEGRKAEVTAGYEKILRDLQKSRVDGEEFIGLRRQVEVLHPLRERLVALRRDLNELEERRDAVLLERDEARGQELQRWERAAKQVTRQLAGRVRVRINPDGNRQSLFDLLQEHLGGRLAETREALRQRNPFSTGEFLDAIRAGSKTLVEKYAIPATQAERLAQASPEMLMQIEELDLPATTLIELNVAAAGDPEVWRALEDLSTGQKATALLMLLLLESAAPLVIDQPEDDLDNRFITEGIVPTMRDEKRRRQFIFSTHNANIPVLGDAELIMGFRASGDAERGNGELPEDWRGSIDAPAVQNLVEEILEGGREAFEMRRLKYGF